MHYREYRPGGALSNYVQCYFTCATDAASLTEDRVFANGCVEIMFNLGPQGPQQLISAGRVSAPRIQLWGQTIAPLVFSSLGRHSMLGVRFFTHTAACFFEEPIALFNNQVLDFYDFAGKEIRELYARLLETTAPGDQISLLEAFLLARLLRFRPRFTKLKLMNSLLLAARQPDFPERVNTIAARHGVSSRYVQKLFITYTGLSPNLFLKIARFQKSLPLLLEKQAPLTAIAYHCGYYDQSHFIKDFRAFTGLAPSHFQPLLSSDLYWPLNG
ncbi:helix-turn-helix domain-containing protein [Hymenobacter ruricola]|uniref:AraC family transcriptional regulator n=1 Tax=Hymenobacter ruricola TaxID=2791023 RepID=A0ABS0I6T3_9BACT|nr:AraC family transcriptional regulator [Hymenobacter ruricola]MBF9222604.1 AraC family transcriptional regulator [Hymenobacter ruricola]